LGDAPLATGPLVRAIRDRSLRYTSDRSRLAVAADRAGDLAARAVFFSVADALKPAIGLRELAGRSAIPTRSPLRVIDLGAGCGAMTLGLLAVLAERPDRPRALEVLALDRDPAALAIARAAIGTFAEAVEIPTTVTARAGDAAQAPLAEAELIFLGSILNELPAASALAVVERALAATTADGAVIAIEPALRETSRALHAVRDAVLARGTGHVLAPCTRRGAPCPALADPRDWCHEDRPLALPPRTAELARLTHLRDGGMKLSYLVLRRAPLALIEPAPGADRADGAREAWRIVSAPRPAKGKLEWIGCSDRGRVPLRLLRRHRGEEVRAAERAERGDVLVVTGAPLEEARVELGLAAAVEWRAPGRRTRRG
jgi:ribosomal protein RSM22 (predicted rRNA methylase)